MRKFKSKEEIEQERLEIIKYMPGAQQQAIDLVDHALVLGWPDHLRQLFIENQLKDGTIKNASGRLRIDLRPGLQELVALIETGQVGAVLVRAIDRLFGDTTACQPYFSSSIDSASAAYHSAPPTGIYRTV